MLLTEKSNAKTQNVQTEKTHPVDKTSANIMQKMALNLQGALFVKQLNDSVSN